jgi:hypothetical protein
MPNPIRLAPVRASLTACVAVVVAALFLTSSALWGADGRRAIPRRPDGRPDLSGTYDVATLTPLVRPAQYGDRLTVTEKEAKEYADHWLNNLAKDAVPSDPGRGAPPKGGQDFFIPEFNGAAGGVGGYNAFFIDLGSSTFKIDGKYRTSIVFDPPNGQLPPLTPEGQERRAIEDSDDHPNTGDAWWLGQKQGPYDDPELRPLAERCLLGFGSTSGPPMLPVMYNNMKRIVQTDRYVMIEIEMNHDARIIRLDSQHPPATVQKWLGDSIGRWEGDTLVVDTTNFRKQHTGFGGASDQLHVVERFTRVDADTVLYKFTVDDPGTWTKSWSGEYPWPATSEHVFEYACHEGNYALGNIMRGARQLEADAMAKKAEPGKGSE